MWRLKPADDQLHILAHLPEHIRADSAQFAAGEVDADMRGFAMPDWRRAE